MAENQTDPPMTFSDLPPEIKRKVFSYLMPEDILEAALVCKEWQKLAFDVTDWETVKWDRQKVPLTRALEGISLVGRHVKKVSLIHWREMASEALLKAIAWSAPELDSLTVRNCNIYLHDVRLIVKRCKSLKELCLEDVTLLMASYRLTILSPGSQLQKFVIRTNHNVSRLVEMGKFKYCHQLTEAEISMESSDKLLAELIGSDEIRHERDQKWLRRLTVGRLTKSGSFRHIKLFSQLVYLAFTWSRSLTEGEVLDVIRSLRNLRHLKVDCILGEEICYGLLFVPQFCGHLEKLEISSCSYLNYNSLEAVASACHQLRELTLHSCRQVTTNGILSFAAQFPRVKSLVIRNCCNVKLTPTQITDIEISRGVLVDTDHVHGNIE